MDTNEIKATLMKFKNGKAIESEEEYKILERYASTGMVRFGFSYKKTQGEASLTEQGKWFVKQL
jgi:hypothetical protein